ncbi:MAG: glycosyltransferase family 2 protein [Acetivibrionales bacterium]|jgi:glycosyltransferase involved in cell wall biosynthesis
MDENIRYSVVVPVYNEEAVIGETYKRLTRVMASLGEKYEIILVNDGSRDKTLELAKEICDKDKRVKLISFSRNFGHQAAITAGMKHSSGEAVIVIDADLQDPPEVIPDMIRKWKEGYNVVYGRRIKRKGETLFKKSTARIFYRALNHLADVEMPEDTGDFRLIDRNVCNVLNELPERNRYVRGLVNWAGFRQTDVKFVRQERFAGITKYPLKKMLKFAADAVISFSSKPLRFSMYLGIAALIAGFISLAAIIYEILFTDKAVPGWSPAVAASLVFSGAMLIMTGILGEYTSRIYDEVKGRPLYIISLKKNFGNEGTSDGAS